MSETMNEWKLTDEQILEEIAKATHKNELLQVVVTRQDRAIAQAAQQRLVKRLHEKCHKHDGSVLRLGCPKCWQELRKEVGL